MRRTVLIHMPHAADEQPERKSILSETLPDQASTAFYEWWMRPAAPAGLPKEAFAKEDEPGNPAP
jgi:hypothetical protein